MSHDDRTSQASSQPRLTPEARRAMLRDFADRMLMKITAMDDPEDLPGVERAVRTAAAIERIYSRCDRAEAHAPDPRKLEAERARNADEATKARITLAGTLEWAEKRRKALGPWWDAADSQAQAPRPVAMPKTAPVTASVDEAVAGPVAGPASSSASSPASRIKAAVAAKAPLSVVDYSEAILAARAELGLKDLTAATSTAAATRHPPP